MKRWKDVEIAREIDLKGIEEGLCNRVRASALKGCLVVESLCDKMGSLERLNS